MNDELFEAALLARRNAYAPYSRCQVGAAIQLDNGTIFSGCNVENASYGATICAERGAVLSAIAAQGKIRITHIAVVGAGPKIWPPCGMCRQVLGEFCSSETRVDAYNPLGEQKSWTFGELLPENFGPDFLDDLSMQD